MVYHAPFTVGAPEPVGRGERNACAANDLDAQHAAFISRHDRILVAMLEPFAVRIAQNVAVRLQHHLPADQGGPSRVNARYAVVFRPDLAHLGEIACLKSVVIGRVGGENGALVGHASSGAGIAEQNQLGKFSEAGRKQVDGPRHARNP
jgi:hypothetical protein